MANEEENACKIGARGCIQKTLFSMLLTNRLNKLECLPLAIISSLVLCLWVRSGAYTRVERLKGASIA